uniref:Protein lifeguard 2 n=1 Tax=Periophthalmus magnuspinnatus TaxID=409849 RepID=A0A3B4ACS0_9GOBI
MCCYSLLKHILPVINYFLNSCRCRGKPREELKAVDELEDESISSAKGFLPPSPPSYEEATAGIVCFVSDASGMCYKDTEMFTEFTWDDCNVRRVFIQKVYSILMIQLLVTLTIVSFCTFCGPVKDYIHSNPGCTANCIDILYFSLKCMPFYFLFSLVFSLMTLFLHLIISFYNTKSVVLCLGITAAVCLLVTLCSFQTKFDITSYQGVLFVFCMVMFISGLVMALVLPFNYVSTRKHAYHC